MVERGNDMDFYLEEAQINMEKAILVSTFYEDMEDLKIREAELKALNDGGSFDSFCEYYEDAASDGQKKDGIIKRAWSAILNFCRKIKEFFSKNNKTPKNSSEKVEEDANDKEVRGKFFDFFKKWGNALSHPKSNPKAFIAAIAPLAALIVAVKAIRKKKSKKVQTTKGELSKETNLIHKLIIDPITKASDELVKVDEGDLSKEDIRSIDKAKAAFGYALSEMNRHQAKLLKAIGEELETGEILTGFHNDTEVMQAKHSKEGVEEKKKTN